MGVGILLTAWTNGILLRLVVLGTGLAICLTTAYSLLAFIFIFECLLFQVYFGFER